MCFTYSMFYLITYMSLGVISPGELTEFPDFPQTPTLLLTGNADSICSS